VRVAVLGGGGFLGSHIVRRLLERGDQPVVMGRHRYPAVEAWGVRGVVGDVRDPAALDRALTSVDAAFLVAAKVGYWGSYESYRSVNVDGVQAVLDGCQRHGVRRLVYTSSPSVVIGAGGVEGGEDESLPYPAKYLSAYGPTKAEGERRVRAAHRPGTLHTVCFRPHFIFGPGDPQVAPRLVARSRQGRLVQIGDGTNQVDVTYIDNCVDAHVMGLDALADPDAAVGGRTYFVGQERPVRLWDFVARILEGFGAPPVRRRLSYGTAYRLGWTIETGYRLARSAAEPPLTRMAALILGTPHWFDHSAVQRDLGWSPRIGLEEALQRTIEHEARTR
jgi:nucleoside-diphosphate-sugar epimerase